jgi:hypothetical protein
MNWKTNKNAPLKEEEQKALIKLLFKTAGIDPDNAVKERIAYVPADMLKLFEEGIGTVQGKPGNTFNNGMVELLRKCEHILMCYQKIGGKKFSILALAVTGISKQDGLKMGVLAQVAGCSLKPDKVKVEGKEWIVFSGL